MMWLSVVHARNRVSSSRRSQGTPNRMFSNINVFVNSIYFKYQNAYFVLTKCDVLTTFKT